MGGASTHARRAILVLALAATLASAASAERLRYLPVPADGSVTWGSPPPPPRLEYRMPRGDDRVAPHGYALDDDSAEPPGEEEQARLDDRIAAALGQGYRPAPALWRIGDRDSTIYLFGTVHVLPPGFRWRSAALDRVVARSRLLLVESVGDRRSGDPAAFLAGARVTGGTLPPLLKRVSKNHRTTLRRFTDTLPPQAAAVLDTLPTWVAAVAVSFVREVRAGTAPGPGADDWLEARFRADGKPVAAIEDGEKVIASVNAIPDAEQQRMLDAALDAPDPDPVALRAPLDAWARGEVDAGSALMVDLAGSAATAALDAPLLERRNQAWADTLVRQLRLPGTMLFAAGAGHFVGERSVIALLERRGVKVRRVQ